MATGVREFLYVPASEVEEALALGAVQVPGDARLAKPRPLPVDVPEVAFDRWRTTASRYRWCIELMTRVLGDVWERRPHEKAPPNLDELFRALSSGRGEDQRVYLYVPLHDAPKVRETPGLKWDRRVRMFYATPKANLNGLFQYLTPEARRTWEAERTTLRTVDMLMREQARREVERRDEADGDRDVGEDELDPAAARDERE
jgi:hypothetical protein